jgi:ABC-type nitrate/sulfonate/bicarbonate transport system substrate-binding protein
MHSRQFARVGRFGALLTAMLLAVTACGGSDDGDGDGDGDTSSNGEPKKVIMAGAPDEILDYLADTGRLAEIEEEWGVKLELTESWDEFAFFAGGHGDIVSTSTYELPLLESETGIKTVTFGKYSRAKLQILVRGDSDYQTMADLEGEKILAGNPIGTTLVWGAFIKKMHDLDFRFEGVGGQPAGDDFEPVLGEHATNPELVVRGDAEACVCTPYLAAKYLRTGELRGLYDGKSASYLYESEFLPGHEGLMENIFTATEEWYDSHPYEVAFFLAVWEEGLKLRDQHRDEIVGLYPEHFAVESQEDIDFLTQFLDEQDPVVESPYLDQGWIDQEVLIFDLLEETGFAESGMETPRYEVFSPEQVREEAPDAWNPPA